MLERKWDADSEAKISVFQCLCADQDDDETENGTLIHADRRCSREKICVFSVYLRPDFFTIILITTVFQCLSASRFSPIILTTTVSGKNAVSTLRA